MEKIEFFRIKIFSVDGSEYQRNGDFAPNRLQAQVDAANLVAQCKLRGNPENNVGIISMNESVQVLSTLSQDQSKLFMKLHQVQPKGYAQVLTAIKVANLALKHRPSKNHKPRIVIFVGSPMKETSDQLKTLAKKLRKEKILVDAIAYGETGVGEEDGNEAKLKVLIDTLNGAEGASLSEALGSSPICRGEDGSGAPVMPGVGGGMDGFDPNEDPELAMALRVSLEEQRLRQEGQNAAAGGGSESAPSGGEGASAGGAASGGAEASSLGPAAAAGNFEAMTEEEQLAYALRMSMDQGAAEAAPSGSSASGAKADEAMDTSGAESAGGADTDAEQLAALISDPNALQELVSNLPGVDPESAEIQQAVAGAKKAKDEKDKKKDEKAKKKDGEGSEGSEDKK